MEDCRPKPGPGLDLDPPSALTSRCGVSFIRFEVVLGNLLCPFLLRGDKITSSSGVSDSSSSSESSWLEGVGSTWRLW